MYVSVCWYTPGIPNDGIPNDGIPNNWLPNAPFGIPRETPGIPNCGIPNHGIPNCGIPNHGMVYVCYTHWREYPQAGIPTGGNTHHITS